MDKKHLLAQIMVNKEGFSLRLTKIVEGGSEAYRMYPCNSIDDAYFLVKSVAQWPEVASVYLEGDSYYGTSSELFLALEAPCLDVARRKFAEIRADWRLSVNANFVEDGERIVLSVVVPDTFSRVDWLANVVAPALRMKWVNVYEVTREYGGPEEGGWWFNRLICIDSQLTATPEEAVAQLTEEHSGRAHGNIYSVLGGLEIAVRIEEAEAKSETKVRPHYE